MKLKTRNRQSKYFPSISAEDATIVEYLKLKVNSSMNIQKIITQSCFLATRRFTNPASAVVTKNYTTKSEDDSWSQIYRFPQIRLLAAFNKLKVYHGAFSSLAIPVAIALEQAGNIPQTTSAVVASLAGTGLISLCLGSIVCRNIVGFVYVNEKGTKLKVSYPDFWGKRIDQEVVIADMIAPSNLSSSNWSPVVPITTVGKSTKYRLLGSFGEVVAPETYFSIFGQPQ